MLAKTWAPEDGDIIGICWDLTEGWPRVGQFP